MSYTGNAYIALHTDTETAYRIAGYCQFPGPTDAEPPSEAMVTLASKLIMQQIRQSGGSLSKQETKSFVMNLDSLKLNEGEVSETVWKIQEVQSIRHFRDWNAKVAEYDWSKAESSNTG